MTAEKAGTRFSISHQICCQTTFAKIECSIVQLFIHKRPE